MKYIVFFAFLAAAWIFFRRRTPPRQPTRLTAQEALLTLGLSAPYTAAQVHDAHHRLVQRLHPDTGGNTFLAAQVNAARDLLLSKL
jgi:DnaJ homolog subfamily C member 19